MKWLALCICVLMTASWAYAKKELPAPYSHDIAVLDVVEAQRVALGDNPSVVATKARVEQARSRVDQATALWWPDLNLTFTGARERLAVSAYENAEALGDIYGSSTDRTIDNFATSLQVTWMLFDGFYRKFKGKVADYDYASQEADLIDSQRLLTLSVAEAFYNAQLKQTYVDIAEADEAFYLKQLEVAQSRYDFGAGPWGDILNIKVQLNSARTSLMLNQRKFEAARYGLAALMGMSEALFPRDLCLAQIDMDFKVDEHEENAEQLIDESMKSRPDIGRLEIIVERVEAGTGLTKVPFYPQVQLAGAINGARQGNVNVTGEDFGNSVSINLTWNLFNGGEDEARLVEARQAKREASYSLTDLRNHVAAEIRQNITLLSAAREQVRLQRESVKLVEENRDLAKNEYESGEESLVRLNEAQRDLITTYSRLVQSLVGYHLAYQRLLSATGRNLISFSNETEQQ